jgi:hypothetical protein
MYHFVEKGHGFLDCVWNFFISLHPHFVLNLVCFFPCLPVLVVVVVVVAVAVAVAAAAAAASFPSGARMLAADIFLCLKLLVCMKLHTCTHTRAHTHTHTCAHAHMKIPCIHPAIVV